MPLEDIEGPGKYPDDLNSAWPLGSDTPSEGDDHLRGIKNVIRNWAGTFGDGPLSDLLTAAFAPLVHTHLWEDITDPPTAFPPLAHTHLAEDVTDLGDVLADYAPLEAPALTGNATIDGAAIASQDYVQGEVHKASIQIAEDHTLAVSDSGRSILMNTADATRTLTIPPNSEVAFPRGTRINIANWGGANDVIVNPGTGVNVLAKDGNTAISGNRAGATLEQTAIDEWWLVGDLSSGEGSL